MSEEKVVGGATSERSKPASPAEGAAPKATTPAKKDPAKKRSAKQKATTATKRVARPYPSMSFEEVLPLAHAIHRVAAGQRVRRLTLLREMQKAPESEATRNLITNSGKYGLTKGSYIAEWIELTDQGRIASDPAAATRPHVQAQFELAINGVKPFKRIYDEYRNKKLPSHEVLKDLLKDAGFEIDDLQATVDLFVVNAKYLGLLQTIAGSEVVVPFDQVIEEAERVTRQSFPPPIAPAIAQSIAPPTAPGTPGSTTTTDWKKICFYITPIGAENSEERRHSDLFLSALIEPALKEFGLEVVRADKIGGAGMITTQVLEHVMRAGLAIVDLSFHNPNAFYEMALRHATGLPVVQICRKVNSLPFDVNQVRTVVIDTTDIYSLVPRLETYRSEIATQVRTALSSAGSSSNPISVFFPGFQIAPPKEK